VLDRRMQPEREIAFRGDRHNLSPKTFDPWPHFGSFEAIGRLLKGYRLQKLRDLTEPGVGLA